jgi:hypothetical protein
MDDPNATCKRLEELERSAFLANHQVRHFGTHAIGQHVLAHGLCHRVYDLAFRRVECSVCQVALDIACRYRRCTGRRATDLLLLWTRRFGIRSRSFALRRSTLVYVVGRWVGGSVKSSMKPWYTSAVAKHTSGSTVSQSSSISSSDEACAEASSSSSLSYLLGLGLGLRLGVVVALAAGDLAVAVGVLGERVAVDLAVTFASSASASESSSLALEAALDLRAVGVLLAGLPLAMGLAGDLAWLGFGEADASLSLSSESESVDLGDIALRVAFFLVVVVAGDLAGFLLAVVVVVLLLSSPESSCSSGSTSLLLGFLLLLLLLLLCFGGNVAVVDFAVAEAFFALGLAASEAFGLEACLVSLASSSVLASSSSS